MPVKRLSKLLLGSWLVLTGLSHLVNFNFSGLATIMAIFALVAGILIFMDR